MLQPLAATSGDGATCQWSRGPPRRSRGAAHHAPSPRARRPAPTSRVDSAKRSTRWRSAPCGRPATERQRAGALVHPDPDRAASARRQPVEQARLGGRVGRRGATSPVRSASWRRPRLRRRRAGALPRSPSGSAIGSADPARAPDRALPGALPSRRRRSLLPLNQFSFHGWTRVAARSLVPRARDVHRAVVHQDVDVQLLAAGDLVEGAVQVVVGHADLLEPAAVAGRAEPRRWLVTWIQWPASCQSRTVSTAPGYGSARGDVLVRVGLLDAVHELVPLEGRDVPVALVLIGQLAPRSAPARCARGGPSSGAASSRCPARSGPQAQYSRRMPRVLLPTPCPARRDGPRSAGDDYGETAEPELARASTGAALLRPISSTARRQLRRPGRARPRTTAAGRVHPRPRRPVAELDREHPAHGAERRVVAIDLPGFGLSAHAGDGSRSRATAEWSRPPARPRPGSRGGRGQLDGRLRGAELAIRHPERVERLDAASRPPGITTTDLCRAPLAALGRAATLVTGYTAARHRALARRPISGTWRWRSWPGTRAGWPPT